MTAQLDVFALDLFDGQELEEGPAVAVLPPATPLEPPLEAGPVSFRDAYQEYNPGAMPGPGDPEALARWLVRVERRRCARQVLKPFHARREWKRPIPERGAWAFPEADECEARAVEAAAEVLGGKVPPRDMGWTGRGTDYDEKDRFVRLGYMVARDAVNVTAWASHPDLEALSRRMARWEITWALKQPRDYPRLHVGHGGWRVHQDQGAGNVFFREHTTPVLPTQAREWYLERALELIDWNYTGFEHRLEELRQQELVGDEMREALKRVLRMEVGGAISANPIHRFPGAWDQRGKGGAGKLRRDHGPWLHIEMSGYCDKPPLKHGSPHITVHPFGGDEAKAFMPKNITFAHKELLAAWAVRHGFDLTPDGSGVQETLF